MIQATDTHSVIMNNSAGKELTRFSEILVNPHVPRRVESTPRSFECCLVKPHLFYRSVKIIMKILSDKPSSIAEVVRQDFDTLTILDLS